MRSCLVYSGGNRWWIPRRQKLVPLSKILGRTYMVSVTKQRRVFASQVKENCYILNCLVTQLWRETCFPILCREKCFSSPRLGTGSFPPKWCHTDCQDQAMGPLGLYVTGPFLLWTRPSFPRNEHLGKNWLLAGVSFRRSSMDQLDTVPFRYSLCMESLSKFYQLCQKWDKAISEDHSLLGLYLWH